jgi:glycosyltransferase involved in cell wall biosynthesis
VDFENLRYEFIVSDDASDAMHLAHVQSLLFDKYVFSPTNKGLGANCNKGIVASKGSYILQIQDDCEFMGDPTLISRAVRILETDPDIGIIQLSIQTTHLPHETRCLDDGTRYVVFENDGIPQKRATRRPYSDQPHLKRRQFFEDLGHYQERVPMTIMEIDYKQRVACQQRWRVAALCSEGNFRHLGCSRSFNPCSRRARRIEMIQELPFLGPIFRRVRLTLRRVRDWVRTSRT